MACEGPKPLTSNILQSVYIYAIVSGISVLMIGCGLLALLAFGDYEAVRRDNDNKKMRFTLYAVGMACLIAQYCILFTAINETESYHAREVILFALIWFGYPIVFFFQMLGKISQFRKDIWFAALDVLSKPLLAVYIAQIALHPRIA